MIRFLILVEPTFMEKMRVRILGEVTDTANRKFAVGTALQLTCTGEVGSEPNNVSERRRQRTVTNLINLVCKC